MSWSKNIPSERREARRADMSPWWIPSTVFLGIIGLGGMFIVWMFTTPIMWATFGPLFVFFAVLFLGFFVAGIILRVLWWGLKQPFRWFGGR